MMVRGRKHGVDEMIAYQESSCESREPRAHMSSWVIVSTWTGYIKEMARVVLAILREIFDESAYARFLSLHRLHSSTSTYAEFLREHEVEKVRRPRCC